MFLQKPSKTFTYINTPLHRSLIAQDLNGLNPCFYGIFAMSLKKRRHCVEYTVTTNQRLIPSLNASIALSSISWLDVDTIIDITL